MAVRGGGGGGGPCVEREGGWREREGGGGRRKGGRSWRKGKEREEGREKGKGRTGKGKGRRGRDKRKKDMNVLSIQCMQHNSTIPRFSVPENETDIYIYIYHLILHLCGEGAIPGWERGRSLL